MASPTPYLLETSIVLARPLGEVFPFFENPGNLEALTPPWLNFRILTPQPIAMRAGALIDYRIRLRGLPLRWRTRISEYRPPSMFIDTQIRGPYLLWEHLHTFEPVTLPDGRPGTRCGDRVRYIPRDIPFSGGLIHRLFVRPELDRIFQYRHEQIARLLGPAVDVAAEFPASATPVPA